MPRASAPHENSATLRRGTAGACSRKTLPIHGPIAQQGRRKRSRRLPPRPARDAPGHPRGAGVFLRGPRGLQPLPPAVASDPSYPAGQRSRTHPTSTQRMRPGPSVREPFRAVPRARDGRSFLRGEPSLSPRKRTGVPCCTPPLLYQRLATRPGVSSGLPVKDPAWSQPCARSSSYGSTPARARHHDQLRFGSGARDTLRKACGTTRASGASSLLRASAQSLRQPDTWPHVATSTP